MFLSNLMEAIGVSKKFDNRDIVKKTDLVIREGSIHVIEGKSGSGKSTLLSMIGGMEKPDNGEVYYKGRSFYNMRDNVQSVIRGRKLSYIFQAFHLIPELTVKENIELPLQFNKNLNTIFTTEEIAKSLGILNLLDKLPSTLSGGEQQRVAIGRALITNPEIIFADEPTGNLDENTTGDITDLMIRLNQEFGIALVIVTHEKNLISIPHHLYKMENGNLNEVSLNYV